MQQPFSCVPQVFLAVEGALSKPRLSLYLPAAKGNPQFALRLYLWNAMICESFYLPCQLAEVSLRNGIYRALNTRYGEDWHSQGRFVCNLPDRHKHDLATAIQDSKVEHGKNATADHIVARMPLGFWAHLFTKNFEHLLWKGGFSVAFPNLPAGTDRTLIHSKIERFRKFRNRTAHHFAIFDKGPTSHYADIVEIIAWSCGDTAWLAKELARVPAVINQRPAC